MNSLMYENIQMKAKVIHVIQCTHIYIYRRRKRKKSVNSVSCEIPGEQKQTVYTKYVSTCHVRMCVSCMCVPCICVSCLLIVSDYIYCILYDYIYIYIYIHKSEIKRIS